MRLICGFFDESISCFVYEMSGNSEKCHVDIQFPIIDKYKLENIHVL